MDLDDAYPWIVLGAILSWAMVILGLVGEWLGWWNDMGEWLITLGALGGAPLTTAGILVGSGRRQVRHLDAQMVRIGEKVDENNAFLQHHTGFFVSMDGKLDKLDKLEDLDVIQVELDKQTGVLQQQLVVLRQMADLS